MSSQDKEGDDNLFIWFMDKFNKHRISVHAAHVTFFMLVSFFPFMMFFVTLLKYTPVSLENILSLSKRVIPAGLQPVLFSWLKETFSSAGSTLLSISIIGALWAGSKGFAGMTLELENIYEVPGHQNALLRRILSIFYTVVLSVMVISSLLILIYGNRIVDFIVSQFPSFSGILGKNFTLLRPLTAFVIFCLYFLCLYRFVPGRRGKTTFKKELPGAVFTAFMWIIFSFLYSLYVDYNKTYSTLYGSLTHNILLMLWLYLCMILVFTGALLNHYLQLHGKLNLIAACRNFVPSLLVYLENNKTGSH